MRTEKTVDIVCAHCGETFQKIQREYKRQKKFGNTRFFCGLRCVALTRNKEHPSKGNVENLIANNHRDIYTPFRWFILRAQYRKRKGICDLTVEFLKQLWEQQNGVCPFTGWKLILPYNSDGWPVYNTYNASLDRIDNSLGYVQGNVRFVSVMANIARQTFTDEQLIIFCKAVTAHVT